MSAKPAPQLLLSPIHHARSAALRLRGALAILALAVLLSGAIWQLEHFDSDATPAAAGTTADAAGPGGSAAETGAETQAQAAPENRRYRALSEFLARRYKVSQAVTFDLVTIAHAAGHQIGVDPLLIIAVMAVESRFNPIAESVAGAKGLMQIIPKYHVDKFRDFGGVNAVFEPETNILVGSRIIKEYLARTGSLNSALQLYGGSTDENDVYFDKVMTEKQRLLQVLRRSS
jgi:soluble lytic murein transglycosylase-like protein